MHLLKYFDKLSLRPENAKEIRKVILDLAIRGQLTIDWRKNNLNVENASVLIDQIKSEKTRLIAEKKTRKGKPLAAVKVEDTFFKTPPNWIWTRIGQISTIKGGKRIPKGYKLSNTPTKHVYIRVTDMKNGTVNLSGLKYIDAHVHELIKRYTISKNDLYITIAGTIGDVGSIPPELDNMNLTENAAKVVFSFIDKEYLKYCLKSTWIQSQFSSKVNQMAQPKLALHRIASTIMPLPPLQEQKAIVRIVDQLMQEVDALEAQAQTRVNLRKDYVTSALRQLTTGDTASAWHELQPHFSPFFTTPDSVDQLQAAILQLAVQGKLTQRWRQQHPEVEPASVLLDRIKAEKARLVAEKKIKKEKPLPEISEEELPFSVPPNWIWTRIGQVSTIKGGKRIPKGYKLSNTPTKHVYIRVTDMKNGTVNLSGLRYIDARVHELIKKYTISKNDLYITIAGTIGDVGSIPPELDNMNLTENAAKVVFSFIDKEYLKYCLKQ